MAGLLASVAAKASSYMAFVTSLVSSEVLSACLTSSEAFAAYFVNSESSEVHLKAKLFAKLIHLW
jgi:hypothetical protein